MTTSTFKSGDTVRISNVSTPEKYLYLVGKVGQVVMSYDIKKMKHNGPPPHYLVDIPGFSLIRAKWGKKQGLPRGYHCFSEIDLTKMSVWEQIKYEAEKIWDEVKPDWLNNEECDPDPTDYRSAAEALLPQFKRRRCSICFPEKSWIFNIPRIDLV